MTHFYYLPRFLLATEKAEWKLDLQYRVACQLGSKESATLALSCSGQVWRLPDFKNYFNFSVVF